MAKKLTQEAFCQFLDITRSGLSQIESGQIGPSLELLNKIVDEFNVSFDWIIAGINVQADVQANVQALTLNEPQAQYGLKVFDPIIITVDTKGNELIPFVNIKSRAGYLLGYSQPEYIATLPHYSLPGLQYGRFCAFQIDGFSMFKEDISEGLRPDDWIICQSVDNITDVKDNRVYTIVSHDEGIITKRVLNRFKNTEDPKLICMSDNKNGNYEHIILKPEQIQQVWEFKLHLNRYLPNPGDLYDKITQIQGDYIMMNEHLRYLQAEFDQIKSQLNK